MLCLHYRPLQVIQNRIALTHTIASIQLSDNQLTVNCYHGICEIPRSMLYDFYHVVSMHSRLSIYIMHNIIFMYIRNHAYTGIGYIHS